MLSLRLWPNDIAAIIIDDNKLILNWIKPRSNSNKGIQAFQLKAHKTIALQDPKSQSQLFNLTALKKHILDFLTAHKIKHAQVVMGLSTAGIIEQFVTCTNATPSNHDFALPSGCLVLDYVYLYPNDTGAFTFYVCSIRQEHLLQYKLLAIAANLNLRTIIPSRMALLQLYHTVQGAAFRYSSLGVAMQQNNNNVEHLSSNETIHRLLRINSDVSINFTEQTLYLKTTLGLALSGSL